MARNDVYIDRKGQVIVLADLSAAEKQLVAALRKRAAEEPVWLTFRNHWTKAVREFYDARGVPRREAARSAVFEVALDLSSRLALASGMTRAPDYRDELEDLIRTFKTRRAFCKAAGLDEPALDALLAGQPSITLKALTEALERIGCTLHIAPLPRQKQTG